MKKDVSSLLLMVWIVFSISLLWVVESVSIIDTWRSEPPEGSLAATAIDDAEADVRTAARVDTCLWLSGGSGSKPKSDLNPDVLNQKPARNVMESGAKT